MNFVQFVENKDYSELKKLVIKLLDVHLDPDSESLMSRGLGEFTDRRKILIDPILGNIIAKHPKRGAILSALNSDTATVGNLLNLMTDKKTANVEDAVG